MKLSDKEAHLVRDCLRQWEQEGRLTSSQLQELEESIQKKESSFDWKNLSFVAFFFSIVCIMLAAALMVVDDWLEMMLNAVLEVPEWVKSFFFFLLAGLFYYGAVWRRQKYPRKVFSNEALFMFGAVGVAFGITFLGFSFGLYDGYFPILILLAAFIYAFMGIFLQSGVNWYLALAALALWFGTETAYRSEWESYFMGMNYPMRYAVFGMFLLLLSLLLKRFGAQIRFVQSTYASGLIGLFFSFWLLSIFGNYSDLQAWSEVAQYKFLLWALLLAVCAVYAIYHGLKHNDRIAREVGVVFLLLNIYTRYFEYFWDSLHKVVFFSLLAISFWLLGRKAENIWNLAEKV
ncbi:MAG: hypothetical protein ACLFUB_02200 [Cyclobacteriaceae bacterium]